MNQLAMARSGYAMTNREGRVLNANAHQLITILLEELVNLLDEICIIHARGDVETSTDQQVMAQSILDSLMLSLDMDNGGELAINLKTIYAHVRKTIGVNDPGNAVRNARAAHQVISEIASAWMQIK